MSQECRPAHRLLSTAICIVFQHYANGGNEQNRLAGNAVERSVLDGEDSHYNAVPDAMQAGRHMQRGIKIEIHSCSLLPLSTAAVLPNNAIGNPPRETPVRVPRRG